MAVALWLLCACVAWLIGSRKDAPFLGLFLGLLLGPFGILASIAIKGNRKLCPSCKEWIHKDARTCPRCREDVSATQKRPGNFMTRPIGVLSQDAKAAMIGGGIILLVVFLLAMIRGSHDTPVSNTVGSSTQQRARAAKLGLGENATATQPVLERVSHESLTGGCKPSGDGQCCGYIDKTGAWVIGPKFTNCYPFSEGLAAAQEGSQWGYIDKYGKFVVRLPVSTGIPLGFSDGLAAVSVRDKCGYVDRTGQWMIPPTLSGCNDFSEELAVARISGGEAGFIDKTGRFVLKPTFLGANDFSDGRAPVMDPKSLLFGFINRNGDFVIAPQFAFAEPFSGGMALIWLDSSRKVGFIDEDGQLVIKPQFEDGSSFSEGLAAVETAGKWGYIDKTGSFIVGPEFNYGYPFSEGLAAVNINGEFGFIDRAGKVMIPPQFGVLTPTFSEGLAPVYVKASEQ